MIELTTSSLIRKFVSSTPVGEIFSTRHCLNFGTRAAVDQALYRMVKDGVITRLARGLFAKLIDGASPPVGEIVQAKAQVFGRQLLAHAQVALESLGLASSTQPQHCYATDGATTSFGSIHGRIFLKHYAPRKLKCGNTKLGLIIRGLWSLRSAEPLTTLLKNLNRTEREALRLQCGALPAVLGDAVVKQIALNPKFAFNQRNEAERLLSRLKAAEDHAAKSFIEIFNPLNEELQHYKLMMDDEFDEREINMIEGEQSID